MAHSVQMNFIASLKRNFPRFFEFQKVLEVGSLDINGSVRGFFENCQYLGIDIGPGPGVDFVCNGAEFDPPFQFDVVLSCNMLEHNPQWKETLQNMQKIAKKALFITVPGPGFPEHGTLQNDIDCAPHQSAMGWEEYYQNLDISDLLSALDLSEFSDVYIRRLDIDVLFYGIKKEIV